MNRLFRPALAAALLLVPAVVVANSGGVAAPTNCNGCHSGGVTPVVTVTPSVSSIDAGITSPVTITVTIQGGSTSQNHGGFALGATAGTFTAAGAGARLVGNNVTHTGPKAEGGADTVTFTATWTPPTNSGAVTFTAWGNKVDNTGGTANDRAASDTATVTIVPACAPSAETCNNQDDNCNGQIDDGASCPANQTCTAGACVAVDAGSGGGAGGGAGGGTGGGTGSATDAGTGGGTDKDTGCGCTSVQGGMLSLLGFAVIALRARRRRA